MVKYLHKYTYKGHERATWELRTNEVQQYLDARYVGPPEGAWRLFAVPMHDKSHHVERLAVHVKGGETAVVEDGRERKPLP